VLSNNKVFLYQQQDEYPLDYIEDIILKLEKSSPREILQIAEKYFIGIPIEDCLSISESKYIDNDIVKLMLEGNWKKISDTLKKMKKDDVSLIRNVTLNSLRQMLFKKDHNEKIAKIIRIISEGDPSDINMFISSLYLGCLQK